MTARATDPWTSHAAGEKAARRAPSHRVQLLAAYYRSQDHGLTDEEAAQVTGLDERPNCAWWKRCSELRQLGLIEENKHSTGRMGKGGALRMVCYITPKGIEEVQRSKQCLALVNPATTGMRKQHTVVVGQDYLLWLEAIMNAARLVVKFDGTDRESLDELQQLVVGRD